MDPTSPDSPSGAVPAPGAKVGLVPSARNAPRSEPRSLDANALALLLITALLAYATLRTVASLLPAIVLGAWATHLLAPVCDRLEGPLRGRGRAATLVTAGLVVLVLAPLALLLLTVVPAGQSLYEQLRSSGDFRRAAAAVVSGDGPEAQPADLLRIVQEHGAAASRVLGVVASASLATIVGIFIFFVVLFGGLTEGARFSAWLETHGPVDPVTFGRLRDAFFQAGRGLLIGTGVTALVQGGIATITYVALGVPRALLLGLLSVVGALIPVTGPTIVWIPVAVGLFVTGSTLKAAIVVGVGIGIIGTIDNLLRPYLTRRANVGLDTSIVLVAMFGGIALFGGWGLLLGPLAVRLTAEALSIVRERRLLDPVGPR